MDNNSNRHCWWYCSHSRTIVRVYSVHIMTVDSAADPQIKPLNLAVSQHPHWPSLFIITTWPKCWYSILWMVEGWVDLGTALRVCSLSLYTGRGCHDKYYSAQCDSNLGPVTPQSCYLWPLCLVVWCLGGKTFFTISKVHLCCTWRQLCVVIKETEPTVAVLPSVDKQETHKLFISLTTVVLYLDNQSRQ